MDWLYIRVASCVEKKARREDPSRASRTKPFSCYHPILPLRCGELRVYSGSSGITNPGGGVNASYLHGVSGSEVALVINSPTIGSAVRAPCPILPGLLVGKRILRSSPPTQDPMTICGIIATNQLSAEFWVVPVFPAISCWMLN